MVIIHDFKYVKPQKVQEAVKLKAAGGKGAILLAGGCEIINNLKAGGAEAETVIDLKGIDELGRIGLKDGKLDIGSTVTFRQLLDSAKIKKQFPLLGETAAAIGSVSIRNRATLVGNIVVGEPYRDSAPTLLVYDAVVRLRNAKGEKEVALSDWFIDARKSALADDQTVIGLSLSKPRGKHGGAYLKLKRYDGQDFGQAAVAVIASADKKYRVAFGSLGPVPVRAKKIEALLAGKELNEKLIARAVKLVPEEISPKTDIRMSAEYRQHMAGVMLERGLKAAAARLKGKGPEYGTRLI